MYERQRLGWQTRRQRQSAKERIAKHHADLDIDARRKARADLNLGLGLKKYRKSLEMTQARFGAEFGCSEKSIRDYENGKRDIPGALIVKIIARGDVPLHALFNIKPDPIPARIKSIVIDRFLESTLLFMRNPQIDPYDARENSKQVSFDLEYFGADSDKCIEEFVDEGTRVLENYYSRGCPGGPDERWYWEQVEKQLKNEKRRQQRAARQRRQHAGIMTSE